jgi:hypothetical protein
MPIPFMDDIFARRCIGWELKLSIWPRRCYYTNKSIWLKCGYKGVAMWTGPGESVFEYRWIEKNEFLIKRLKGML